MRGMGAKVGAKPGAKLGARLAKGRANAIHRAVCWPACSCAGWSEDKAGRPVSADPRQA